MLNTILAPLTTATSIGVAIRYLTTIAGSVLTVLGILGWLSADQVAELTKDLPGILSALGALLTALIPIYAVLTKSSSNKAAEVAKKVDAQVPADASVVVKTPARAPDIVVHPK